MVVLESVCRCFVFQIGQVLRARFILAAPFATAISTNRTPAIPAPSVQCDSISLVGLYCGLDDIEKSGESVPINILRILQNHYPSSHLHV